MSNETSTLLTIVALFITTGATVTYVFQQARLRALMEKDLRFRISPLQAVPEEAQVSIGRVSVFRQGRYPKYVDH